ncbi:MAG TPA: nucleoside recognition domain-containing protein [Rhodothermales bacterium]|nr:nucleoside recognition domain-containing protein [Rhodothermales bacterium]
MLNYIWAGLIVISLVFALVSDIRDSARDTYRNGQPLPVMLAFPSGIDSTVRTSDVVIRIDTAAYHRFYRTGATPDTAYTGTLVRTQRGTQIRFAADADLPEPLATIWKTSQSNNEELQGRLVNAAPVDSNSIQAGVVFEPARYVKLHAITAAAFDLTDAAVTLALQLIGVIALFLGLLRIAEAAGIVNALVHITQPIFRPLFPEIPEGHPAMGMIVLNLTANMLGLGNAATPLGLKAMEELQKLNLSEDTATNSMVMLLALNTASVQFVPPTLLVAIMGLQVNELMLPILICTFLSGVVAVIAAKLLGKLPGYRSTDPMRQPPAGDVAP